MSLVTDPDDLNQGVEVIIDTSALTIQLVVAGNLSNDGVTGQAKYSFLKEEWRTDSTLIPFPFPMVAITPEQFEFIDGWKPADDTTRNLIRSAGWREISAGGAVEREYLGVVSLGFIDPTSQPYFAFSTDTASTDFDFTGPVNQGIQTFGDASNGNFDKRTDVLTLFIRTQGNTYGAATSESIGVTAGDSLNYIARRFPLAEANDLKITASDSDIQNNAPYTGMSIRLYPSAQVRSIGGVDYNFGVIIDGNNGTAEEIYEFVQYSLRQNTDIDPDGGPDIIGSLLDPLAIFVGNDLQTLLVNNSDGGGGGVYIDNFDSNDTNRISFTDSSGAARTFPFVAAGAINFSSTMQSDADAIYRMFFTTNPAGDFGTSTAVLVDNNAGVDISGNVSGVASVAFDFDYDGNAQGGRTPGTDADVTIVGLGLNGAQYVLATGTITRATGLSFTLTSALERNYANP